MKNEEDQLPNWEQLNPNQKDLVTKAILKARMMKFALLAVASLAAIFQPMLNSMYSSRNADRQVEIQRIEQSQKSAMENTRLAMESLNRVYEQIAVLKVENETLRKRIADMETLQTKLQTENADLSNQLKSFKTLYQ